MTDELDDFDDDVDDDVDDDLDDDFDDEVAPEGNRILGARARAVADHLARNLADEPDAVEVDLDEVGDDRVSVTIHASPDDMGRLIGKRGRVIQAIRQVTRAAAASEDLSAEVDVAD